MKFAWLLLVALLIAACGRAGEGPGTPPGSTPEPTPAEIASSVPSDPDEAVLHALKAAGSDLSRPHEIEFFVYVPTMEACVAVSAALVPAGFPTVGSKKAADGSGWVCTAKTTMVPDLDALRTIRRKMEALAAEHGGEYDGWGAPVVGASDR